MTEVSKLKKSRSANKNAVNRLVAQAEDKMQNEYNEDIRLDVEVLLRSIKAKENLILKLDSEIVSLIDDEAVDDDVDQATDFGLKLTKDIAIIERYLAKTKANVARSEIDSTATNFGVKLPKIHIKKFSGDPTAWQQFQETFEATVDKNQKLSAIEKFSYLKGYLAGAAEKCIEGLSLSNDNYNEAWRLLRERYGNPQLIIASHMDKILKIDKVSLSRNCKELRSLYDHIESHVRSLNNVGVKPEHYGPLLIPIILEKLPDEIKLQISRKLGTSYWMIEDFMKVIRDEVTAREICYFVKTPKRGIDNEKEKDNHCTTEALLTGAKVLVCAFCQQNHYHDKCNVVTELERRKEMVRKHRLCFKCLMSGHPIRKCMSKGRCYQCKSTSHHTAICEKDQNHQTRTNENVTEDTSLVVNSQTTVLLQTANGTISDNGEKNSQQIKVLLDLGSTKTYLSTRIAKKANLKPIGYEKMNIKTFGNTDSKTKTYTKYEFCLKNPKRGCNMYMQGFAVPVICSPLTSQRVEITDKLFPVLKDMDLSDVKTNGDDVDLLIGADNYWNVIEGETKSCSHCLLV